MLHGRELVENFLFTNTEATMSLSFSLNIFKLDGVIEAALVEVRSRFIIVHLLIHMSHLQINSETVASSRITIKQLALLQILTDLD